jgi:hypothetical protein
MRSRQPNFWPSIPRPDGGIYCEQRSNDCHQENRWAVGHRMIKEPPKVLSHAAPERHLSPISKDCYASDFPAGQLCPERELLISRRTPNGRATALSPSAACFARKDAGAVLPSLRSTALASSFFSSGASLSRPPGARKCLRRGQAQERKAKQMALLH